MKRYLAIWFPFLVPDRLAIQNPELHKQAFVTTLPERGRLVIQSASLEAVNKGVKPGMILADSRAVFPDLIALEHDAALPEKLLHALAAWVLRFTPVAAIDLPNGLLLDISGCAHLWGGESLYSKDICTRLNQAGYAVNTAIADTIGTAWALSRYGTQGVIVASGKQRQALLSLPVDALRIDAITLDRLYKLGLSLIGNIMDMPTVALRTRFGQDLPKRLEQALGTAPEFINPICLAPFYHERLSCLEPLRTAKAIEVALQQLLEQLCHRLLEDRKGLRKVILKCYRVDNEMQQIEVGTNRAVRNKTHLFRLLAQKIGDIKPGLGIELFVLEAPVTEPLAIHQEQLWQDAGVQYSEALNQLIDRIGGRIGSNAIQRYLPAEHHWPERSFVPATAVVMQVAMPWPKGLSRPVYILPRPEPVQVSVPIPDYPPMLFIYKGEVHKIKKADGPERIEREWWIEKGLQRDYYCVEDESGARYWLFRSGHYDTNTHAYTPEWFIHGFFA